MVDSEAFEHTETLEQADGANNQESWSSWPLSLHGKFFQTSSLELSTDIDHKTVSIQPTDKGLWNTLSEYISFPVGMISDYFNLYKGRQEIARKAEASFIAKNNTLIDALRVKKENSAVTCSNIKSKIEDFLNKTENQVSAEKISNIIELITVGENIATALFSSRHDPEGKLVLEINGQEYEIESNSYTTLALSWYMMASAASQDVLRNTIDASYASLASDMLESGTFIMKDPDQRIYKFLTSNKESYKRISTHFAERVGHDEKFIVPGVLVKPLQNGIEDFERRMPGQSGTILFDCLKPSENDGVSELFVKFESTGCPPLFNSATNADLRTSSLVAYAAIQHHLEHTFSFLGSRGSHTPSANTQNVRQEHLYKGVLEHIYKKIISIFEKAGNLDQTPAGLYIGNKQSSSDISKKMKKFGLPAAKREINALIAEATTKKCRGIRKEALNLLADILRETQRLGLASDQYGIERRGAEVHISLNPSEVEQNIHQADRNYVPQTNVVTADDMPMSSLLNDSETASSAFSRGIFGGSVVQNMLRGSSLYKLDEDSATTTNKLIQHGSEQKAEIHLSLNSSQVTNNTDIAPANDALTSSRDTLGNFGVQDTILTPSLNEHDDASLFVTTNEHVQYESEQEAEAHILLNSPQADNNSDVVTTDGISMSDISDSSDMISSTSARRSFGVSGEQNTILTSSLNEQDDEISIATTNESIASQNDIPALDTIQSTAKNAASSDEVSPPPGPPPTENDTKKTAGIFDSIFSWIGSWASYFTNLIKYLIRW
ncbi:hypothetical protein [Pseudochelatococcus sp. G4_1912]|uniref:hypothetical protein n=1 Tax=Pseudochelatococcus sp. G4_1912 TaxID=3114288 RepID=UPI0039C6E0B1